MELSKNFSLRLISPMGEGQAHGASFVGLQLQALHPVGCVGAYVDLGKPVVRPWGPPKPQTGCHCTRVGLPPSFGRGCPQPLGRAHLGVTAGWRAPWLLLPLAPSSPRLATSEAPDAMEEWDVPQMKKEVESLKYQLAFKREMSSKTIPE